MHTHGTQRLTLGVFIFCSLSFFFVLRLGLCLNMEIIDSVGLVGKLQEFACFPMPLIPSAGVQDVSYHEPLWQKHR